MTTPMIPPKALEEMARKYGIGPYAGKQGGGEATPQTTVQSTGFSIEELEDRFVLNGVHYRNGIYTIEWSKQLLDNGEAHTQDEWLKTLKGGEWSLADAPLNQATMTALYEHKDDPNKDLAKLVRAIQKMLKKDFEDNWMITGSRVVYRPEGNDKVIHNYATSEEYAVEANIVGPDGFNKDAEDALEALLDTKDIKKVKQVIKWTSGKKPYLCRLNTKPEQDVERVVVLGVGSIGRFIIVADFNIGRPARGVRAAPQKLHRK